MASDSGPTPDIIQPLSFPPQEESNVVSAFSDLAKEISGGQRDGSATKGICCQS